jgi:oxygen-independent coproporphyrinogen-3 oxidase
MSQDALQCSPLSLYVHIPSDVGRLDRYGRYLCKEIVWRGAYFDRSRVVEQLHFGGGTPTFLTSAALMQLMHNLAKHFQLTDAAERDYSIEIDPRSVDRATLLLLSDLGFNRVSLGAAPNLGSQSVNFDLIYGLPMQSLHTTHANRDVVSFGVGAIGRVGNLYLQNYVNHADYEAAIERGMLPTERGINL